VFLERIAAARVTWLLQDLNPAWVQPDSFDNIAGSISNMFQFDPSHRAAKLFLNSGTGEGEQ
jgi:hypothetical protein